VDNKQILNNLESITESLNTGDLIFFQGTASDSVLIRNLTGGLWSHCAMVIRGIDIGSSDHQLLLFESSIRPGKDLQFSNSEDGSKSGVMLVELHLRMNDYADSRMYSLFGIRRLVPDKAKARNFKKLTEFVQNRNVRQSGYPAEYLVAAEHFMARELESEKFRDKTVIKIKNDLKIDSLKNLSDDQIRLIIHTTIESVREDFGPETLDKTSHQHAAPSHYFCSELVVDALMHMGLLELNNAASYSPNDLSANTDSALNKLYADVIFLAGDLGREQSKKSAG